ncbi:MAG: flagellin lysine-N-methylase [Clostridia bacterium]|nr:flagellin lysine-N-methylase [Clostridia bacterium]
MKLYAPDYYPLFSCTAGACRHSCCIGWEIDIDDETLEKYRSVPGAFGKRLKEGISEKPEGSCFQMKDGGRCPFLNESGLCDIIIEFGEDALSDICADHPRFRNYLSDRTEIGLGLTCETAAELILSRKARTKIFEIAEDDEEEAPLSEFEKHMLSVRSRILSFAYDSSLPIYEKLTLLLQYASPESADLSFEEAVQTYLSFEILDDEWRNLLKHAKSGGSRALSGEEEPIFSNLLGYFVYRHITNAWDECDLAARASFIAHAVRFLITLCENRDPIDTIRMYSSEIEYSDENLERLLEIFESGQQI